MITEKDQSDPNPPRRELSNGGLEINAALLVCWQIDFSCASGWSAIQLYQKLPILAKNNPNSAGAQIAMDSVCESRNYVPAVI